jgi:hypothetical protein
MSADARRDEPGPALRPASAVFQLLERAVERRDHAGALRHQRRLRELGYSVCYIGRRGQEGRAVR